VIGKFLFDCPGIQESMSDYYYTNMRNVFVGSLCAIGVFLLSYHGYERKDDIAGDLACIFAIGVALFPTEPVQILSSWDVLLGNLHLISAAGFFLTLAYFSLALFRQTNPKKPMTKQKRQRNRVYSTCGYAILVCISLIAIYGLFFTETSVKNLKPVFWLESSAVVAFGFSWLTKGEAILKDDET
jgi:amino acid transporter